MTRDLGTMSETTPIRKVPVALPEGFTVLEILSARLSPRRG
jgi:hypothetical protein